MTRLDAHRPPVASNTPLLLAGRTTVTHGEIDDHAARLSSWFAAHDVEVGATVVVISADAIAAAKLAIGVVRSGRCLCVVDEASTAREVRSALLTAGPSVVFAAPEVIERCDLRDDASWIIVAIGTQARASLANRLLAKRRATDSPTGWPGLITSFEPAGRLPDVDPESPALLVFTSGSTGRAKGVELSRRAVVAHLATVRRIFEIDEHSILHNVLPLSHVDGLIMGPLLTYSAGAAWARPCEFSIASIPEVLDAVYRERATHLFAVPTMLALFDRLASSEHDDAFDHGSFRMVISSAGPLTAALWERFEQRFSTTVCNSYGLSETVSSSIASGPESSGTRRVGTIGKPIDCTVDLIDDHGAAVADGEIGEIVITGDHVFSRYRNAPEETTAVLDGRRFRTGDLARRDADGYVELHGRKSSMIVRGGRNVSPVEVDAVIGRMTGVTQTATVGIADTTWGQRVETMVVGADEITPESVLEFCRRELAAYKVPQRVVVVDALPLTGSGKVDAHAVRSMLREPAASLAHSTDVDETVLDAAAQCFGVSTDHLSLSTSNDQLDGWDSLAHLDLVEALELHFEIEMTNADILSIERIADAADVVRRHLA